MIVKFYQLINWWNLTPGQSFFESDIFWECIDFCTEIDYERIGLERIND